jgi:hypothetical protein
MNFDLSPESAKAEFAKSPKSQCERAFQTVLRTGRRTVEF